MIMTRASRLFIIIYSFQKLTRNVDGQLVERRTVESPHRLAGQQLLYFWGLGMSRGETESWKPNVAWLNNLLRLSFSFLFSINYLHVLSTRRHPGSMGKKASIGWDFANFLDFDSPWGKKGGPLFWVGSFTFQIQKLNPCNTCWVLLHVHSLSHRRRQLFLAPETAFLFYFQLAFVSTIELRVPARRKCIVESPSIYEQ